MHKQKLRANKIGLATFLLAVAPMLFGAPQNAVAEGLSQDENAHVSSFEQMNYPALAQYVASQSQGIVIIRVKLDETGRVLEATALSGQDILVPDCLANVKKWRFQPNPSRNAIVIYNFRIVPGECSSASSVFAFEPPNFATVVGCWPVLANPLKLVVSRQAEVSDQDIAVLNYEPLKYSQIAKTARVEGVVVVRVKLDAAGRVREANALSGTPMLIPDCLANAKKWRFRANAEGAAIIAYNFKLVNMEFGSATSQFIFEPPNFVTILAAPMTIETDSSAR